MPMWTIGLLSPEAWAHLEQRGGSLSTAGRWGLELAIGCLENRGVVVDDDDFQIGAMLRVLRRRADLSQRELAHRSGVPQATLARIESGATQNPSFRLLARLVRAADARLTVETLRADPVSPVEVRPVEVRPVEVWPAGAKDGAGAKDAAEARDRGGRHFPAHLDSRPVRTPSDWWGAWWTSSVIPAQWPMESLPDTTFDRNRSVRDERRARVARGMTAVIRRLDEAMYTWVAESPSGDRVGMLRAHPFEEDTDGAVVVPGLVAPAGAVMLDIVTVRRGWRRLGIGSRLLECLCAASSGPVMAPAAGHGGRRYLESCGFRPTRDLRHLTWFVRRAKSESAAVSG